MSAAGPQTTPVELHRIEGGEMTCKHDLADMDTAAHWDGLCPICLEEKSKRLRRVARYYERALRRIRAATACSADHLRGFADEAIKKKVKKLRAAE